jgi:ribonucleoside-diphosphate reductase alpha chain
VLEPFYKLNDEKGEIGVCILSAVNMLKIESDKDHEKTCDLVVRMLDNLIDIQTYFDKSAERFATKKRSIGVGITNLAGWLASKGENHCSENTPELINEFMEKQQYFLLKASNQIAKERGRCEKYDETKYSQGLMPLDFYNTSVDEFLTKSFFKNGEWEELKKEIEEHGLRNCTLSCQMPCEASSSIQGSTNGMEPIRSLITFKTSRTSSLPVLAPNLSKWKNKYIKAFDMPNNDGMIKVMAAINKWLDMSSSFNLYSPKGEISMGTVAKDILTATKYGAKTFYYHNTDDEDVQNAFESGCSSGSCTL